MKIHKLLFITILSLTLLFSSIPASASNPYYYSSTTPCGGKYYYASTSFSNSYASGYVKHETVSNKVVTVSGNYLDSRGIPQTITSPTVYSQSPADAFTSVTNPSGIAFCSSRGHFMIQHASFPGGYWEYVGVAG